MISKKEEKRKVDYMSEHCPASRYFGRLSSDLEFLPMFLGVDGGLFLQIALAIPTRLKEESFHHAFPPRVGESLSVQPPCRGSPSLYWDLCSQVILKSSQTTTFSFSPSSLATGRIQFLLRLYSVIFLQSIATNLPHWNTELRFYTPQQVYILQLSV